jgi:uncharacterized glyoxalase superfamily protein PhnB
MSVLPILAVKDFDTSLKFYTEQLGFAVTMTMQGPDGSNSFGFVNKDNVQIGLSLDKAAYERGNGVVLMLYPDDFDIEVYYKQVTSKGVTIAEPLKTEYWGDQVFSLKDPDGYYLTFGKTVQQVSVEDMQAHMRGEDT